jgi:hypothetical protein
VIRRIFEALVRPFLRAPIVVTDLEVDDGLLGRWVSLPAQSLLFMGTEDGGHITANGLPVRVMEGDGPSCSAEVAQRIGTTDVVMRRRVLYVFFREVWALSWTLVGMVTVLITLSGDAQKIAAIAVVLGLVFHSMTLRVSRTPRK